MAANYKAWAKTISIIGGLVASFSLVAYLAYQNGAEKAMDDMNAYYVKVIDERDKAYSNLSNDYSATLDNYAMDTELLNEAIETIETNRDTIEAKNLEIRLLNAKVKYMEDNPTIVEKVVTQTVEVPTYIEKEVVKEVAVPAVQEESQEDPLAGYTVSNENGDLYIQSKDLESNLTVTYNGDPEADQTPSQDTNGNWLLITDK